MKKGVVLEIKRQYLVMLTPEGEFVKGKNNGTPLEVGEEIFFYPYEESKANRKKFTLWSLSSSVAAILFICFLIINPLKKDQAFAYVTMDMDSSIEFVLDENLHIIGTHAYNSAGEKLLSTIQIEKNQLFTPVATKLINQYDSLNSEKNIVIASISKDEKNQQRIEKEVQKIQHDVQKKEANIKVIKGSMKERASAQKKGISAGKFISEENKGKKEVKQDRSADSNHKTSISNIKIEKQSAPFDQKDMRIKPVQRMRKDEEKKWKQERIEKEIKKETQKETDTKVHIHNENRNEQNWSHIKDRDRKVVPSTPKRFNKHENPSPNVKNVAPNSNNNNNNGINSKRNQNANKWGNDKHNGWENNNRGNNHKQNHKEP
ncbi:anti-sigma factor domain-containing protein [Heyndrickxia oleronia]|uniref:anti-sigma factor domain-containing protein n=1 Tax=Heyndrickxia oleronia TaxID=38875 RepID=UPI00090391A4|nr:anti-sigma factor domain-containing protein [Heyndrickxia oleronia]MCM3453049.1 anti-sigma factor domain-containing protein [Heyndrickxia oleronia]OJH17835.1 hypothetical protein BLX88_15000 [Bacillus obstructivus]